MTVRALILGFLGAMLIASFGYINDSVLQLNFLVGNHFPIVVFGGLVPVVIAACPMIQRWRASMAFQPAELAVVCALVLIGCSIPGGGLMRRFTAAITLPIQYNQEEPGWKNNNVLGYAPPQMLPGGGAYDPKAMNAFLRGTGSGKLVDLGAVPWRQWFSPLATWLSLVFVGSVAIICISLIVHRQWASRERIRYPIAEFANLLISGDGSGPLIRNRLFWLGLLSIFLIRCVNGLNAWFPDADIKVPLVFDFSAIGRQWPSVIQAHGGSSLLYLQLFPTAVAFAYFLASDVGLSLGLSQPIVVLLLVALTKAGIEATSSYTGEGTMSWQLFGSYLAMGLLILYIGRRYYWDVARQGLTFVPRHGVEGYAAWAFRILLLAFTAAVTILIATGLDWPFAILTVGMILLAFTVVARISAENGVFHCEANWQSLGVILGLFGAASAGPKVLVIVGLLCAVWTLDFRECLMPFVVNGLKICDNAKVKPGSMGLGAVAVLAVGLVLAAVIALASNYSHGVPFQDGWGTSITGHFTFNSASRAVDQLRALGRLEASQQYTPVQRLMNMQPDPKFLWAAGIGFALVLTVGALRQRLTWWPLHPVMFLVWNTYPLQMFSHSFLLGWFIKTVVTRLGGSRRYLQFRPLMIGVIAGDMVGGLLFMGIGAAYHAITGLPPTKYWIFPP